MEKTIDPRGLEGFCEVHKTFPVRVVKDFLSTSCGAMLDGRNLPFLSTKFIKQSEDFVLLIGPQVSLPS
jgi:hypothetical protein